MYLHTQKIHLFHLMYLVFHISFYLLFYILFHILSHLLSHLLPQYYFLYCLLYCFIYCLMYYLMYYLIFCHISYFAFFYLISQIFWALCLIPLSFMSQAQSIFKIIRRPISYLNFYKLCLDLKPPFTISHVYNNIAKKIGYIQIKQRSYIC